MIATTIDPILRVRGLTKRYGAFTALSNVDLEVANGEFVALLGPSGCGKSTTLMALAGFVEPDEGTIALAGRDITRLAPEHRRMGVVFQDYALFPHLSVLDNVAFPLRMRGMGRGEREGKALAALEQVQLPEKSVQARPGELSGGQKQRVAVARALVFDPIVLLMDEPLAALDRRLRQHLQFELRRLQARLGTTVVYVTHDQEEALVLADRIVVMRDGRFEQVGPPREVYDRPVNAFVAGFLGESNSIPVWLGGRGDGRPVALHGDRGLPVEAPASGVSGEQALLVVRPERLKLVAATRDERVVPARVTDVAFLGDRLRVELSLFDGVSWTASISTADFGNLLNPGAEIGVTWSPSDARLLPTGTA